jgi:hypothetical protein
MSPPKNARRGRGPFIYISFVLLACVAYCLCCESVLALGCCKFWGVLFGAGGVEGRAPGSMSAAAVESDAFESYFFSFINRAYPMPHAPYRALLRFHRFLIMTSGPTSGPGPLVNSEVIFKKR